MRLPSILNSNELSEKMFNKGWKFNQFNSQGQVMKQLSAVSVIFAMVYFSLAGSIMKQDALSITVFVYSMICLFSFVNVTYVRDFDALQINVVPIALSLMAMSQLHHSQNYEFC